MPRRLSNWLKAYIDYTEDTESPKNFHIWVGMSIIAAALQKKAYFKLGRILVSPNMYVVLVGPPGVRKSQAIDFGVDLLDKVGVKISADTVTVEALYNDLAEAKQDAVLPDGSLFTHCSLSIISRELEVFLGQKQNNMKMLSFLTNSFDASLRPFEYKTKNSGITIIPSIYVNILAATTPDSIASCLPPGAIGGGLTSRILFISANQTAKRIPIPEESAEVLRLKEELIADLIKISQMVGIFTFTSEAVDYWVHWYMHYADSEHRICKSATFDGWYMRKPMYVLKVSQAISASTSSSLRIEAETLQEAINYIESVELNMEQAFTVVGRSEIAYEINLVRSIVRQYKTIREPVLFSKISNDIDSNKFKNVIETLIRSGEIQIINTGTIISYKWVGKSE